MCIQALTCVLPSFVRASLCDGWLQHPIRFDLQNITFLLLHSISPDLCRLVCVCNFLHTLALLWKLQHYQLSLQHSFFSGYQKQTGWPGLADAAASENSCMLVLRKPYRRRLEVRGTPTTIRDVQVVALISLALVLSSPHMVQAADAIDRSVHIWYSLTMGLSKALYCFV